MKIKQLKEMDKQNSIEKIKSILNTKSPTKNRFLSNTAQNFNKITPLKTISNFKGFFNKRFNLTKYKNERQNAFALSHSLEKIIKPHELRGNGIPNEASERIRFLKKILTSEKFQNYYKKKPKKKDATFESMTDYIVNYKKKSSDLEAVLMAFYFLSHEIKYLKNNDTITEKNLKATQKPEYIFESKKALSIGFTNFFEYFLKRMEIRYKHIEGFCKLIPKNNSRFMTNSDDSKINANSTHMSKSNAFQTLNTSSSEKDLNIDEGNINHCWNAIYIRREWYFVDALLASGGVAELKSPQNQDDTNCVDSDYNFNPYYFMILPQHLIITHKPVEDLWQFTDKTLTLKQFLNRNVDDYSHFYKGIYQHDIEFLSHSDPLIKINLKNFLVIKLRLKNSLLGADLFNNAGSKILEIKYSFEESTEIFTFEPIFPSGGDYIIRITARSITSTDLVYWPLIDYIVKVENKTKYSYFDKYKLRMKTIPGTKNSSKDLMLPKLNKTLYNQPKIISDYLKVFPSRKNKKICYDNEGFHLIEPKTYFLKKGATIKFKIKMKGVGSIAILDGNQLFYLKKTERNVYEGEKEVKTDNVCICCVRGKNVLTEVFRFKELKEKSVDSKLFFIKIKKNRNNE